MHAHACDHRTSVTQRSGRCAPHNLHRVRAVRCCATASRHTERRGTPAHRSLRCRAARTHMLSAHFGGAGCKPIFETRLWAVPQTGTRMYLIHLTIMSTAQAQQHHAHPPPTATSNEHDRPLGCHSLHPTTETTLPAAVALRTLRHLICTQGLPELQVHRHRAHPRLDVGTSTTERVGISSTLRLFPTSEAEHQYQCEAADTA